MGIGFTIILTAVFIKYKPEYKVSMNKKSLGYINAESDIDKYIEEIVNNAESDNIAFINLENTPSLKLQLVDRNLNNQEETIKNEIQDNLTIEYVSYAIAINGENKTYLSSDEEAQNIVEEIKKDYDDEYIKKITILPVYSEDYKEIACVENNSAKELVIDEINKIKKETEKQNSIKLASKKKKTTSVSKSDNIKGIKFSVRPISGTITSRYGYRSSPGGIGSTNHKGLDIAAPNGTAIKAAASGTVKFSGNKGQLGKLIIIDHGNGVQTFYGHCSSLYVSEGTEVKAGDTIAAVGRTGSATGYHLHFEIRLNGTQVNPQRYIY